LTGGEALAASAIALELTNGKKYALRLRGMMLEPKRLQHK
jgi:hypothetical protein